MVFGALIIGDEILSGKRSDRHFVRIADLLEARGLRLSWVEYLRDDSARIAASLRRRSHRQGLEIPHGRYNVRLAQARATAAPPDPAHRCHSAHDRPPCRKDCTPNVRPPACLAAFLAQARRPPSAFECMVSR